METKGLKALRIGLASPEVIRSWSYGEVLNLRRLIIDVYALKKMAYFVRRFLVPHGITNVIVESTKIRVIKGSFVINAALKSRVLPFVVNGWGISH